MATTSTNQRGMRVRTVMPFFALSFGLTWGIAALLILFPNPIVAIFGELNYTNPVYILAVYAPESSALSWFGATSAAVVIVWLNRKTMFAREGAPTAVLAPGDEFVSSERGGADGDAVAHPLSRKSATAETWAAGSDAPQPSRRSR